MTKDFRFGVGLLPKDSRSAWQETARRAEGLGFDIIHVPDHLGAPAPFPSLVSAAEVTTIRLGTFVLNAGFYKPALLARDAAALDMLSDGRFELGLGTGYVQEEFEAAELPFPSAGRRVDYLEHTTAYMQEHVGSVPILIAGSGDRVLTIAARRADIIGIAGAGPDGTAADPLGQRTADIEAAPAGVAEVRRALRGDDAVRTGRAGCVQPDRADRRERHAGLAHRTPQRVGERARFGAVGDGLGAMILE